ncbi:MAG: hypothetical protein LBT55_07375 [Clostridiaceae bacterium]|jgi:hypothetical protein|nr:hypothetical protein [Clostridiaceae bacterium]
MIVFEQLSAELKRTYSDTGMMIRKAGDNALYNDAVDAVASGFIYEESDVPVAIDFCP